MLTLLTTLPLLLGPADPSTSTSTSTPAAAATAEAPPPGLEEPEFDAAVQRLREAEQGSGADPEGSTQELLDAIAGLEQFGPQMAQSEEAREARQTARLILAGVYLFKEDLVSAAKIMDEAIREAMGEEVPAANYGPNVKDLYEERLEVFAARGRAELKVRCVARCKVYVNEVEVGPEPPPLPLGTYRVWVEDSKGEHVLREEAELSAPDQIYEIEFAPVKKQPKRPPPPPEPERIMPREAQIALIIVGTGLTTTGAVLTAMSEDNPGRLGGGVVSLVAGGALLSTGIVTVSIDEVRHSRWKGRQATLNWTMKF